MSATRLDSRAGTGSWVTTGALMGLAAGVIFLVFEMVAAGLLTPSAFGPPRMMSATVLGQGALPGQSSVGLAVALPVALVVHFTLSAIYGAVFGGLSGAVGFLRGSRGVLIAAATVFGLALWLVNFYVIAPVLFPWFLMANPVVQFLAHTFFFGTVLGLLLAGRTESE